MATDLDDNKKLAAQCDKRALELLRDSLRRLSEDPCCDRVRATAEANLAMSALSTTSAFRPRDPILGADVLGFKLPANFGKLIERQIKNMTDAESWKPDDEDDDGGEHK